MSEAVETENVADTTNPASGPHQGDTSIHLHPDDVLADRALSASDKRAILAGWISDRHAVPDQPAMRQLPNGAIVAVDDVLAALQSLDRAEGTGDEPKGARAPIPFPRHRWRSVVRRLGLRSGARDPEDDDDPPPGGASAPVPILIPALAA